MIEPIPGFPPNVLAFACKGRVTRADYETVLIPAIDKTLKTPGKLRLLYELGPAYAGFDAGAMWDDFKVGLEHLTRWERIALVTDVDWIRHTMDAMAFLMPAKVRVFPVSAEADARKWIVAD